MKHINDDKRRKLNELLDKLQSANSFDAAGLAVQIAEITGSINGTRENSLGITPAHSESFPWAAFAVEGVPINGLTPQMRATVECAYRASLVPH